MNATSRRKRREQGFLRAALTGNLGLKLLSFVLALALTAYLRGAQDEQQRTVPVDVVARLPAPDVQRELMTLVPPSVHVTVRGSMTALDQLMQSGVPPVELDLRKGTTTRIVFDRSMFSMPPGVEVNIIDPASIELEWQDVVVRQVPIQTSMIGQVAPGHVVKSSRVEPETIAVEGPRRLVDVIQFVRLEPFDVSGKTAGVHRHMLALDAPPPRTQYLGPATAHVSVIIEKQLIQRKLAKQEVRVVGPSRAKTDPRRVDITITGPPEVINDLRDEVVIPRVDLADIDFKDQRHGSSVRNVEVDLAKVDIEIQPPTVTVRW